MTLEIFRDLPQGGDEWAQARAGLLTASTMGRVITTRTLKPADNEQVRSFAAQIAAERITGQPDHQGETWDMRRGTLSEPYARELYEKHTGQDVAEVGLMVRDFEESKIGFSPDGLVGNDGLIEIKSPRPKAHVETILSGYAPDKHLAQIHAGLLVSDRDWCDYISYSPGLPLFIKTVERNPAWDKAILTAAEHFEQRIKNTTDAYSIATLGMPETEWLDVFEEERFELIP